MLNKIQKRDALEGQRLDRMSLRDELEDPDLPKESKLINAKQITHAYRQVIKMADEMEAYKQRAIEYLKFVETHPELLAWRNDKLDKMIKDFSKYNSRDVQLNLSPKIQVSHCRTQMDFNEIILPNSVPARLSIPEYLCRVKLNNVSQEEDNQASEPVWFLQKVAWRYVERDNRILDTLYRHNEKYYDIAKIIHYMLHIRTSIQFLKPLCSPLDKIEPRLLKSYSTLRNQLGRVFYDKWHKLLYLAIFKRRGEDFALYNYSHFLHNISLDKVTMTSLSDFADYLLYIAPHEKHPIL